MECRLARQSNQIAIAFLIFRKHKQVVILVAFRCSAMIVVLADIELTPENRLDSLLLHCVKEVHSAIDISMVGHRSRGLANFAQMPGELIYITRAIEKGVISMKMKVGELCCHCSSLEPYAP